MSVKFKKRGTIAMRRRIRAADRAVAAVRLRRDGLNYAAIGDKLGMSEAGAYLAVKRGLGRVLEEVRDEAAQLLAVEYERLESERAQTFRLEAEYRTALVKTRRHLVATRRVRRPGRDSKVETVNPRVVEQYRALLDSLARLIETRVKISDRLGRLLGLDQLRAKVDDGDNDATAAPFMQVNMLIKQELAQRGPAPPSSDSWPVPVVRPAEISLTDYPGPAPPANGASQGGLAGHP
jgi:hypothetical protein